VVLSSFAIDHVFSPPEDFEKTERSSLGNRRRSDFWTASESRRQCVIESAGRGGFVQFHGVNELEQWRGAFGWK
jgi:hypothetical protein